MTDQRPHRYCRAIEITVKRLILAILTAVFALQLAIAAKGVVICRHADGSERVETLIAKGECCEPTLGDGESDRAAPGDCVDTPLAAGAVAAKSRFSPLNAVAPPLALCLPFQTAAASHFKSAAVRFISDGGGGAAPQRALLLSTVILLI